MTDKLARIEAEANLMGVGLASEIDSEDVLALVNIAQAAQVVMQEVEADLPIKCLICAWPNDEHVDGCPVPDLRAALAALDKDTQ